MDQGPLVIQQIDAGAKFVREFSQYAPIHSAFWAKEADAGQWYLYVASEDIDDTNFDVAYGEVTRLTASSPDPWLDPFQIKVVNSEAKLAQAVAEVQKKYGGRLGTRYHGGELGGLNVEEVYIYPTQAQVTT